MFLTDSSINILLSIFAYSTVSTSLSVIYIGGYTNDFGENNNVMEYKHLEWTKLGTLETARSRHTSIQFQNRIYIMGGWSVP